MRKIKPIDYGEFDTDFNRGAVCPYCGYENEVCPERYKAQDEEDETVCDKCKRFFIYTIDYDVTFCSYPYENWAFKEINRINRRIEIFKDEMEKAPENLNETTGLDKSWYERAIKYEEEDLDELKKKVNKVLGPEED